MSTQISSRKKVELSPYKQKLQTNAPSYEAVDTTKKKLYKNYKQTGNMDLNEKGGKHNYSDKNDNDALSTGSRPDVLSLDSDFDSGNCLTESPDQDSSPCLEKQNRKFVLEGMNRKKYDDSSDAANYSYCTPPNHMASAISRVHLGKKAGHKKKGREGPPINKYSYNVNGDPISADYNHVSQGSYGRVPINGQHGLAPQLLQPSSSEPVTISTAKTNFPVTESKQQVVNGPSCTEEMDMKYTDLTHMQLKRSLEQIHSQNVPTHLENGFGPNLAGNFRDYTGKTTYSSGMPLTYPSLASHAQENVHVVMSNQPSKYDAILKVKDAMLQEKESVILKLRLEVASLQHQVQESDTTLRQVIQAKNVPKNMTSHHNQHTDQQPSTELFFRKKIHHLEELLGKAEYQLTEIKSEHNKERNHMEEKLYKLEAALKGKDQTFAETKKKYKLNAERLEKYKKRVESLERYLGDLPTLEESNKLKTEAGMLGEERENLVAEITALKEKLQCKTKELKDKDFTIEQYSEKESAYLQQIKHLEDKCLQVEKSKMKLGATERDELEDLKYECSRLKKENENAGRMVTACERRLKQHQERHAEEISRFEQKLSDAEETNENMRREQFLKQQTANKVHTAMMSLSEQNQELLEEKLNLQEKVKNLEKSQAAMDSESRVFVRLQRETHAAVHELKAVSQVLIQTAEGSDPNLSALLGVRSDSLTFCEDKPKNLTGDSDIPFDSVFSVESANKSILDVRKLRQDLDQLRTMMTNQYAENIGENCTTQ